MLPPAPCSGSIFAIRTRKCIERNGGTVRQLRRRNPERSITALWDHKRHFGPFATCLLTQLRSDRHAPSIKCLRLERAGVPHRRLVRALAREGFIVHNAPANGGIACRGRSAS